MCSFPMPSEVVEPDAHGDAGCCRQCAPAFRPSAFACCQSQSRRDAASGQRLHHPLPNQTVSDTTFRYSSGITGRPSARRTASGWHFGGTIPRSLSVCSRMFAASQSCSGKTSAAAQSAPAQEQLDEELSPRQERRSPENLIKVGWAKTAQPASRLLYTRPPLQSFTRINLPSKAKPSVNVLRGETLLSQSREEQRHTASCHA